MGGGKNIGRERWKGKIKERQRDEKKKEESKRSILAGQQSVTPPKANRLSVHCSSFNYIRPDW